MPKVPISGKLNQFNVKLTKFSDYFPVYNNILHILRFDYNSPVFNPITIGDFKVLKSITNHMFKLDNINDPLKTLSNIEDDKILINFIKNFSKFEVKSTDNSFNKMSQKIILKNSKIEHLNNNFAQNVMIVLNNLTKK
jgi:hypothetical protein